MAKLSRDDVLKLANLARLHLDDEEIERYSNEISAILEYVEQLQSINLDDTEPTFQVNGLTNSLRPDVIKPYGATPAELLKNVPATQDGQIKVKRMIT